MSGWKNVRKHCLLEGKDPWEEWHTGRWDLLWQIFILSVNKTSPLVHGASYVSGTVLSAFHIITHVTLKIALGCRQYHYHHHHRHHHHCHHHHHNLHVPDEASETWKVGWLAQFTCKSWDLHPHSLTAESEEKHYTAQPLGGDNVWRISRDV